MNQDLPQGVQKIEQKLKEYKTKLFNIENSDRKNNYRTAFDNLVNKNKDDMSHTNTNKNENENNIQLKHKYNEKSNLNSTTDNNTNTKNNQLTSFGKRLYTTNTNDTLSKIQSQAIPSTNMTN